jgi:tetratricopeptide (TPR) repeat protein
MYFVVVLSIAILGYLIKKKNYSAVFFVISVVSLAPLFSPVQVAWVIAERYLYVATAFSSILLVLLIKYLSEKYLKEAFTWVLVLISVVFGIRVFTRNIDWQTFDNFAVANARVSPNSPQALNALGDMYFLKGDLEKSKEALEKSVALYPEYSIAVHNLGRDYYLLERIDDAEKNFRRALELNPNLYQSMTGLGIIELRKGNREEALRYANDALKLDPQNEMAQKLKSFITTGNVEK